jgi:hypothetical protein
MDGRLSDGGQVNTLDALKGRGATQHNDYWEVPLSEASRGKLSLGDLTVLFQFVTEPPRQPKPMLPASVRGSFADRIDPQLAVILGISILAHFALVIFAYTTDPERDGGIAERAFDVVFKPETISVDLTPPPPPTNAPAADSGAAKKPDAGDKGKKPDKTPAKPKGGGDDGGRKSDNSVALQEQAVAFANALTSEGEGQSEFDMGKRRPGSQLGQEINDVRESGKQVAVGGGSGRGSRGNGDPRVGTGTGPNLNGQNGVESAGGGKSTEKGPAGRISVADKQTFDESTLTPDIVYSKILAAYMAGLKRCYKEYLKKDASARGKVALSFSVNSTGRATGGKAKGFAGEVDDCIGGQMGSWRFPVPKDKDGEPTDASFQITLQLVPD